MPSILIVDDEANIRSSLQAALGREGYQVETAASLAEAPARCSARRTTSCSSTSGFRTEAGSTCSRKSRQRAPETVVIMMSGHATIDVAVRATKLGAFDFLEKPISLERLLVLLRNASAVRRAPRGEPPARQVVGRADRRTVRVRSRPCSERSSVAGPSTARVLIRGENGTGKELVARALHAASPRRDRAFVAVNCSAIPEELIESELFGHERGAFTGATQSRRGRFEEAHGGTLFLDEVGDLSPRAQTKLLRVLEEGEFFRVGGNRSIRVDVRVIAATNRDLAGQIRNGAVPRGPLLPARGDPDHVPPLRERPEDIPLLVEHFAAQIAMETKAQTEAIRDRARSTFSGATPSPATFASCATSSSGSSS